MGCIRLHTRLHRKIKVPYTKTPKNTKIHFSKTILRFPKMDIKKYVHFSNPQKSLPKKKFFFIITNQKSFFRKWERFLAKSLFCTFLHISRKSAFFGSVLKNAAFFRTLDISHTRLCNMLTDLRRNRHFLRPYFGILKKHRTQKTPHHHWWYFLIKNRDY